MLQIIYNSTPLWDYFINNCQEKAGYNFIRLQKKQNFWSSRKIVPRIVNMCVGKYLKFEYRYVINGNLSQITNSDTILLLGIYNFAELLYLRSKFKKNKICLWFWNPLDKTYNRNVNKIINKLKSERFDIFTFDENDAQKFQINLRPQFSLISSSLLKDNIEKQYDVYFLGQPKGRLELLRKFKQECDVKSISCYFKIVNTSADYISYEQNIMNVCKSKSVLEFCQNGQCGLTLRALEATLCHRKLITNNKSIVKEDFYNPQNIFIIGKDRELKLQVFINSDFLIANEDILKKYDFNNWLDFFYKLK